MKISLIVEKIRYMCDSNDNTYFEFTATLAFGFLISSVSFSQLHFYSKNGHKNG